MNLPQNFSTMNFQDRGNADWYMDTGKITHLHADSGILKSFRDKCNKFSVIVGNGSHIHVTHTSTNTLSQNTYRTLSLKNVLITP